MSRQPPPNSLEFQSIPVVLQISVRIWQQFLKLRIKCIKISFCSHILSENRFQIICLISFEANYNGVLETKTSILKWLNKTKVSSKLFKAMPCKWFTYCLIESNVINIEFVFKSKKDEVLSVIIYHISYMTLNCIFMTC